MLDKQQSESVTVGGEWPGRTEDVAILVEPLSDVADERQVLRSGHPDERPARLVDAGAERPIRVQSTLRGGDGVRATPSRLPAHRARSHDPVMHGWDFFL